MKSIPEILAAAGACLFLFANYSLALDPARVAEPKTQNGIPYVSGGVGEDEEEAIRAVGKQYNLKLSFAVKSGEYLADVKVKVQDKAGKVMLDTVSEGPCFFAKVPKGTYRVTAESAGQPIAKTATVGATGSANLNLYWGGPRADSDKQAKAEEAVERKERSEEEKTGHGIHGCW